VILRQFLPAGVSAFKDFLANCRNTPDIPVPRELLDDGMLTEVIKPAVSVDAARRFTTRRDAAEYLTTLLTPLSEQDVATNAGLWTWLTLFYFDDVCPPNNGLRYVKNDYYYNFEPKNSRHFYRHLLFIAWRVARLAPKPNRLFLTGSVSTLDKVTEEVMKRLYLTRIPCIFDVLDQLYWDNERGRARVGITDTRTVKAGDLVHRFPIRMRQLEKTYDLNSLEAPQLIELLGKEFQFSTARRTATAGAERVGV
jgi:hypothetical protein